jgi:hypothetical protein
MRMRLGLNADKAELERDRSRLSEAAVELRRAAQPTPDASESEHYAIGEDEQWEDREDHEDLWWRNERPPGLGADAPDIGAGVGTFGAESAAPAALASSSSQDSFLQAMRLMAEASAKSQADLLKVLVENSERSTNRSLRPDKPKLTAENAVALKKELKRFRLYMNEAKIADKSKWFDSARIVSEGRALAEAEAVIIGVCGNETKYQELLKSPKDPIWITIWEKFESRLKIACGLDDSNEMNEAVRTFSKITLSKSSGIAGLSKFLDEYAEARTAMLEHELVSDVNELTIRREIEEFKTKIEGSDALTFLLELPTFPTAVTSQSEAEFANTLVGR